MNKSTALSCPSAWRDNTKGGIYKTFLGDLSRIRCIVEIGVDYGYSLFSLANDFPEALVVGVDNFSFEGSKDSKEHLQNHLHLFKNIRIFEASSEEARKIWANPDIYCDIDLLHIDADHLYDSVKRDFELWVDAVSPGGVIMFHDIKSFPDDVGKFFDELEGKKERYDVGAGLGFYYKEE